MKYSINPNEMSSFFAVPSSLVEKHLRLAGAIQLKVLLWSLKNLDSKFSPQAISEGLKINLSDAEDALKYWVEAGILTSDSPVKGSESTAPDEIKMVKKVIRSQPIKPSREDVAARGLESSEVAFILREAQSKFGRTLRQNESSTLLWLYDDQGMSSALILMLLDFSVSQQKANIGFIERTAIEWIESGITDISLVEKWLIKNKEKQKAWSIVESTMGIEHRSPSKKELLSAYKWVNEWEFDRKILRAAYEVCVDTTSKFSLPYISKVLEKWHLSGVKSINDIEKLNASKNKDKASNNKSDPLMEKMLIY